MFEFAHITFAEVLPTLGIYAVGILTGLGLAWTLRGWARKKN